MTAEEFSLVYHPIRDVVTISAAKGGFEEDGVEAFTTVSVSRPVLLQFLLEELCRNDESFGIFMGKAPGEEVAEKTEMAFLSPPTDECILNEEDFE